MNDEATSLPALTPSKTEAVELLIEQLKTSLEKHLTPMLAYMAIIVSPEHVQATRAYEKHRFWGYLAPHEEIPCISNFRRVTGRRGMTISINVEVFSKIDDHGGAVAILNEIGQLFPVDDCDGLSGCLLRVAQSVEIMPDLCTSHYQIHSFGRPADAWDFDNDVTWPRILGTLRGDNPMVNGIYMFPFKYRDIRRISLDMLRWYLDHQGDKEPELPELPPHRTLDQVIEQDTKLLMAQVIRKALESPAVEPATAQVVLDEAQGDDDINYKAYAAAIMRGPDAAVPSRKGRKAKKGQSKPRGSMTQARLIEHMADRDESQWKLVAEKCGLRTQGDCSLPKGTVQSLLRRVNQSLIEMGKQHPGASRLSFVIRDEMVVKVIAPNGP